MEQIPLDQRVTTYDHSRLILQGSSVTVRLQARTQIVECEHVCQSCATDPAVIDRGWSREETGTKPDPDGRGDWLDEACVDSVCEEHRDQATRHRRGRFQ